MDGFYEIKLSDVFIRYYDKLYHIKNHVYYRALINDDDELYEKEINRSEHQKRKSEVGQDFLKLKDSIETHGYRPDKSLIIIKFDIDSNLNCLPYVIHGRHRIALLMYIYGPNLTLIVEIKNGTGKVIGLK